MNVGDTLEPFVGGQEKYKMRFATVDSLDDRVVLMIEAVLDSQSDDRVFKVVSSILQKSPVRDYDDEIKKIFNWVRDNIRYTRDPYNLELFRTPRRAIDNRIGDCDDMSILLAALLRAVGYSVRFRIIGLTKGNYEHVYVVVGSPPETPVKWIPLDPSQPNAVGWEYDREKIKKNGESIDYDIDFE